MGPEIEEISPLCTHIHREREEAGRERTFTVLYIILQKILIGKKIFTESRKGIKEI